MPTLITITDATFGLDTPVSASYRERRACRAVVFDSERRISLLHATVEDYYKLPGGGVEADENLETALRREVMEEIGCDIGNVRELGVIEEFRHAGAMHQVSYCFMAECSADRGETRLTKEEEEAGFVPVWMPLDEAIRMFEEAKHTGQGLNSQFVRLRELTILKAAAAETN